VTNVVTLTPKAREDAPSLPQPAYAELQVTSCYSFLRGASKPHELVKAAHALGLKAIAIADRNSLAGVVKAFDIAEQLNNEIQVIIGCCLELTDGSSLLCFPQNRAAYSRLVRLLTLGKRRTTKGECHLTYDDVLAYGEGQIFVALGDRADDVLRALLQKLRRDFPRTSYLALTRRFRPNEVERLDNLCTLAAKTGIPTVATNDVQYHVATRRMLHDVMTCIRASKTIDTLGYERERSADRFLKRPAEMERLFVRHPDAFARTMEIAARCTFSLRELEYQYPDEAFFTGMTAQEGLERATWEGAAWRYPHGIPDHVRGKLNYELRIIAKLNYAPYFLTVWRIVKVAREKGILCQGRGSAANSAVCYCLGITEIDPAKNRGLFERFISEQRGEPPDIDVDFEHERREEVIQWIYETYGRDRAALTATVIHYRSRRAVREVGKALGFSEDVAASLVSLVWGWSNDGVGEARARELGLDPNDWRLRLCLEISKELIGFPRHLSQHPGGFVITKDRLDDLVPIENATMAHRTVIEWDKDDIETLRMMKVDVLGLGMLGCLRRSFNLLRAHKGIDTTIAKIPNDDAAVYEMLCKADSIGVFQVESRAQMSMLPRLKPRKLYDLVVEVAIVRPGPIQGDMVHPYLRRRQGIEKMTYPLRYGKEDPKRELEAVLERTMGVPLFQEQAMEIAIVGAGFLPDEADKLRRAMATFRNDGRVSEFKEPFVAGMLANGYEKAFAERCFKQIEGFGTYGFPESHAASFAILVNASAWVKCHHPDVFLCAILNAQPMGFYAPAQLIRDAKLHGVDVLPVDVNASQWDCTLEPSDGKYRTVRLGFRVVKGASEDTATAIVNHRIRPEAGKATYVPYETPHDVWRRSGISARQMKILAEADAFAGLDVDRRHALWSVKPLRDEPLPLFAAMQTQNVQKPEIIEPHVPLQSLSRGGEVAEDYSTLSFSLRDHPLKFIREDLRRADWSSLDTLKDKRNGDFVRIAGLVLVRQRPGTASGIVFVTMEDEIATANLVVWSTVFDAHRSIVMGSDLLACCGTVQEADGVIHVVAKELYDISAMLKRVSEDDTDIEATARDLMGGYRREKKPKIDPISRDFH